MKTQKILIITMLLCLGFATACDDDGGGGYTPPTPPEPISLVGIWYEVGSTENKGIKVTFTETHCIPLSYWKDYVYPTAPELGVFNDTLHFFCHLDTALAYGINLDTVLTYEILSDSVIQFMMSLEDYRIFSWPVYLGEHSTSFFLNGDVLIMEHFRLVHSGTGMQEYPEHFQPIKLIKENKND